MATIESQILGLDALHRALQNLPANIERNIMLGALRAGQNVFKARAKAGCPVGKTGALKKSIRVSSGIRRGLAKATLIAGNKKAWYAHIIEFGSGLFYANIGTKSKRRPYDIKAKKKKALHFNNSFRKKITHPGIRPVPFMRRALDAGIAEPIEASAAYIRARLATVVRP